MKQTMQFSVGGEVVQVPQDEMDEFNAVAKQNGDTPEPVFTYRVSGKDGTADEVDVPKSQYGEFEKIAKERGDRIEPMRLLTLDDGTERLMGMNDLHKFFSSDELMTPDEKAQVAQTADIDAEDLKRLGGENLQEVAANEAIRGMKDIGPNDVPTAQPPMDGGEVMRQSNERFMRDMREGKVYDKSPTEAFFGELGRRMFTAEGIRENAAENGSARVYAFFNDLANSLLGGLFKGSARIEEGFGRVWNEAGDALGNKGMKDAAQAMIADAQAGQAAVDRNLPTDMLDTKGPGAVNKVLQAGKNVAGMTGEFAPAAIPGVGQAYAASLVGAGTVNRYAQVYDEAIQHGLDPRKAEGLAFGAASVDALANMLLMGKFRGIWSGEKKAMADMAKKRFVQRALGVGLKMALETAKVGGTMAANGAWQEIVDEGAQGATNPDWAKVGKVAFDQFIEGGLFHLVNSGAHHATRIDWSREPDGIPAGAARDMMESPEGRALIFCNSPQAAAQIFRARKNGEDVSRKMIRDLGLSENTARTVADRNAIGDRLLEDYQAFKERVRTKMDDVQASALADEIASRSDEGYDNPAFEKVWTKAVAQIKDAREIDDPERRKEIVDEALKTTMTKGERLRLAKAVKAYNAKLAAEHEAALSQSRDSSPKAGEETPIPAAPTKKTAPKPPEPPKSDDFRPVEPSAGVGAGDGTPEAAKPVEGGKSGSVTSVRVDDIKPGEHFTYDGKELYRNKDGEIVEIDVGKDGKPIERPTRRHFTGDELVDLPDRAESANVNPVADVPEEAARQHLTPEGDLKSGGDVAGAKPGDTLTVGKSNFKVVERDDEAGTIKVSDETGATYEVNENGEVREAGNGRSGKGGGVEGSRASVQQDAQGQAAEGDRKAGTDRDQGRADGGTPQGEGGVADAGRVAAPKKDLKTAVRDLAKLRDSRSLLDGTKFTGEDAQANREANEAEKARIDREIEAAEAEIDGLREPSKPIPPPDKTIKPNPKKAAKIVGDFVATDPTRKGLMKPYHDKKNGVVVATNGWFIIVTKHGFDPNAKEPEEPFPNWKTVIPKEKDLTASVKVNPTELAKVCQSAIRLTRAVGIKPSDDNSTPHIILRNSKGGYSVLDANYLLTVAKAMEANGITELRVQDTKGDFEIAKPLVARNADTTIVIMPLRGSGIHSTGRVDGAHVAFDGTTGRIIHAPERTDVGALGYSMSEERLKTLRDNIVSDRQNAEFGARNTELFKLITDAWKRGEKDPNAIYKGFNGEQTFDSLTPENKKTFMEFLNAGSEEELARMMAEYMARKMPDAPVNRWVDKDPKEIAKIEKRIAAEDEVESLLMRDDEAREMFGLEPRKRKTQAEPPKAEAPKAEKPAEEAKPAEESKPATTATENIPSTSGTRKRITEAVGKWMSEEKTPKDVKAKIRASIEEATKKLSEAQAAQLAEAQEAYWKARVDEKNAIRSEEAGTVHAVQWHRDATKARQKANAEVQSLMEKFGIEVDGDGRWVHSGEGVKPAEKPKSETPAKPAEEKPAPVDDIEKVKAEVGRLIGDHLAAQGTTKNNAAGRWRKVTAKTALVDRIASLSDEDFDTVKKSFKQIMKDNGEDMDSVGAIQAIFNAEAAKRNARPAAEKRLTPETATVEDVTKIMSDRWNEVHAKDANYKPSEPKNFARTAEQLLKNIREKNADGLISTMNGLNPASLRAFEVLTGIKMPRSQRDQHALIDKFCGVTPEARAKIEADRKAEREAKYEAERRAQSLAEGEKIMKDTRVRMKDGEVVTAQKLLEDGWTVKRVKRGAASNTHLVAPDGSGYFKIDGKAFEYAEDFIARRKAEKPAEGGKSFLPGGVIEAHYGLQGDEGPQPKGWRKLMVGKKGPVVLKVPDNETFKKFVEENYGKVVGEADVNAGGVEIEGGDIYNVSQVLGHMAGATGKVEKPMREGGKDETQPVPTRHNSGRYSTSRPEGSIPQAAPADKATPAAPPTKDAVMAAARRLGVTAYGDDASLRAAIAEAKSRPRNPQTAQRISDLEAVLADREAKKPVNRIASALADGMAAHGAGDAAAIERAKAADAEAREALRSDIENGVPFPTEAEVEAAAQRLPEPMRKPFVENMNEWRKYADKVRETESIGDTAKGLADDVDAAIEAEEAEAAKNPAAPAGAPRGRGTGTLPDDEPKSLGTGTGKRKVVTPQTFLREAQSLFPDVAFRRKSTVRMPDWAAGHFEPAYRIIRAKDMNSIRTVTHELGHDIEHLTRYDVPRLPAVKRDLSDLGHALYGPGIPKPPSYIGEGFAEYVRGYVCNAPNLATVAPDLHAWFTGEFKQKHPDIVKKLDKLRDMVQTMKEQSASEIVGGFMRPSTSLVARAWKKTLDFFSGENWNDSAATILRGMKKSGIARLYHWQEDFRKLEATKDPATRAMLADMISDKIENHPYIFATITRGTASQRVMDMARHGTTSLLGNRKTGESLKEIFEDFSPAEREAWKKYAVARHGIANYFDKNLDFGLPRDVLEEVVREYDSPKFQDALQRYTEYSHRILHLGVDAGLISQETYDKIVAEHPIYVRITRRYANDGAGTRQSGQAINKRTGGFDHILDPIDAALMDQEKFLRACFQAKTLQLIVKAGKRAAEENVVSIKNNGGPGSATLNPPDEAHNAVGAYWPVEVPNAQEGVKFTSAKLGKQLEKAANDFAKSTGADPIPLEEFVKDFTEDNASLLTIFRDKPSQGKHNLVSVYIDGKLHTYELPDMKWANMLTDVYDKSDFNALEKTFGLATAGIRLGATTINSGFALRNGIRDSLHSAVMSESGALPLLGSMNGMIQQLLGKEAAVMFRSMGGHMSDLVGVTKEQKWNHGGKVALAQNALESIGAYSATDWALMKPVIKACADVLSYPELGPRIREMSGVLAKGRKAGLSEDACAILAMSHAKDISIDFQRAGRLMKRINHFIPFSNAMWRGTEQTVRNFGLLPALPHQFEDRNLNRAGKNVARGLAFVTSWVATLAMLEMSGDEKDRRAAFERSPTEKWEYEHVGDWRFPLPFELGFIFGAIPKAAIYEMYGDKGAMKECLAAFNQAMPSKYANPDTAVGSISLFTPWIGLMRNQDYRGRPIVPQHIMENREEKDWYTQYTTELSKKIGAFIGKSPAQLEYLLDSYTGGLYRRVATAVENVGDTSRLQQGRGFSFLDTLRARPQANRLIEDFYRFGEEGKRKLGSGTITLEEYGKLSSQNGVKKQLTEHFEKMRAIRADKSIPLADQDRMVNEVSEQANEVVRTFNARDDYRQRGIAYAASALTGKELTELDDADREKYLGLLKGVDRNDIVQALIQFGSEAVPVKERGAVKYHQRWSSKNINQRVARLLMLMNE